MQDLTNEEDRLFEMAVAFLEGIGPVLARNLISYCGTAKAIFSCKKRHLEKIPGIGPERASAIVRSNALQMAEKEMLFISKNNIKSLFLSDKAYPRRLKQCDDAPVVIYYKGQAELNPGRLIAVVGTRHITTYGRDIIMSFIEELKAYEVTIVSGLAYGVDITAHKESLRLGIPTIGVTAHGLDRIYPAAHRSVAEKMMHDGGLLTEYPSGTNPDRDNFPARNRIVAGMTDATVVIESAVRGGALITAEFANDYNREVFAFPGRTGDTYSKGCNALIRNNKAVLIESAAHLAEAMNWNLDTASRSLTIQMDLFADLTPIQEKVSYCLRGTGWKHLDTIALECHEAVSLVSAALLELEFKGLVGTGPGKMFRILTEK